MIEYIPDFYSPCAATDLFEYIKTLPFTRPRVERSGGKYGKRRLSFPGYAPSPDAYRTAQQRDNAAGTAADAPPPYQKLAAALTAYRRISQNYFSTIGFLVDDFMAYHQHHEDMKPEGRDQTVIVLSLGACHPVSIRYGATQDVVNPKTGRTSKRFVPDGRTETIYPAHGSIYVLDSDFNRPGSGNEAEHAVLPGNDWSHGGLRISINTKHIPPGLTDAEFDTACSRPAGRSQTDSPFVREPGPPRIYNASGKFPDGAVYAGRGGTFMERDFPPSPFGNFNRHHLKTAEGRTAWAAEVREKMTDPAFLRQVKTLRGKDLICHCSKQEIESGECHAATWLELANGGKP